MHIDRTLTTPGRVTSTRRHIACSMKGDDWNEEAFMLQRYTVLSTRHPVLIAHRPEPIEPPSTPEEPDTVPDPAHEPTIPDTPPIGDPPPQPNQTPYGRLH